MNYFFSDSGDPSDYMVTGPHGMFSNLCCIMIEAILLQFVAHASLIDTAALVRAF